MNHDRSRADAYSRRTALGLLGAAPLLAAPLLTASRTVGASEAAEGIEDRGWDSCRYRTEWTRSFRSRLSARSSPEWRSRSWPHLQPGRLSGEPGVAGTTGAWTSAAQEREVTMSVIQQSQLLFVPGTSYSYRNCGYYTLGAIVLENIGLGPALVSSRR